MAKSKPASSDMIIPIVSPETATAEPVVPLNHTYGEGIATNVFAKLKEKMAEIWTAKKRVETSNREFSAILNSELSEGWYLIASPHTDPSAEAKAIRPFRQFYVDSYVLEGKSRLSGNRAWGRIREYAREEAEPAYMAQIALEKAEKSKSRTPHNAPKDPTPRIIDVLTPVYKFLINREDLNPSELEAQSFISDAILIVGGKLPE